MFIFKTIKYINMTEINPNTLNLSQAHEVLDRYIKYRKGRIYPIVDIDLSQEPQNRHFYHRFPLFCVSGRIIKLAFLRVFSSRRYLAYKDFLQKIKEKNLQLLHSSLNLMLEGSLLESDKRLEIINKINLLLEPYQRPRNRLSIWVGMKIQQLAAISYNDTADAFSPLVQKGQSVLNEDQGICSENPDWENILITQQKELLALARCSITFPLMFKKDPLPENIDPEKPIVILTHGYLHNKTAWRKHKHTWENRTEYPMYTHNLGHMNRSIQAFAQMIIETVEKLSKETKCRKFILVGHSMGGTASAYAASMLDDQNLIQRVITIASPLNSDGTKLAHIGFGQCARQMEPDSNLLQRLEHSVKEDKRVDYRHVTCKYDLIVPCDSEKIEGNQYAQFDDEGHLSPLFSDQVGELVGEWIADDLTLPI